ncbi:MAG: family 20 glycosylhydrolase, partial [Flavobacteriaceae bacterium]|nr:family 20 glycosylhydrolase [Flavobacteriaceae bacterium]
MKLNQFLLTVLFVMVFQFSQAQNNLIPAPVQYEASQGTFMLKGKLNIVIENETAESLKSIELFRNYLSQSGIQSELTDALANNNFIISINKKPNSAIGKEGYTLEVKKNDIVLNTNTAAGVFNGLQSLKQLLPYEMKNEGHVEIQSCKIVDYPRFAWRGLMLDVSRHFFTVEEVKAYLDKMSEYKFNVFHWHLTDDQGWRIEIKSLPKLTDIGAWRVERHGRFGKDRPLPKEGEKATYGGYYTQDEIKDIVKYASDRNITIVPEIDIPGHSMAALAAYPELSVNKKPTFVVPGSHFVDWQGGGKFEVLVENTLNPADENVYDFVDKVFSEVAELFPGEYIHMGGDEAYHGYWERDAGVQKFMKKNQIKDGEALQSYFVKRVEKIISSKGKKMIGWDEILEGGLAEGAAVMSWRGMKGGIKAAKMEHKVVMSPTTYAYLDYTQGDKSVENRIYSSLSLEKVYEFEPMPEGVKPEFILGGQGNLWTEGIATLPFAFYMTYPRAFALSESLWSKQGSKNWNDFVKRTEHHFNRFEATDTNISKAVLEPQITVFEENGKLMCKLENSIPETDFYYTIDNSYPVKYGHKYTEPFVIPEGDLDLHVQTFRNGQGIG